MRAWHGWRWFKFSQNLNGHADLIKGETQAAHTVTELYCSPGTAYTQKC